MESSRPSVNAGDARSSRGRHGCLFYAKRGLTALLILVLGLALLGFVYETVAEANDRQAYPPPGQVFGVDGHAMHIRCTGEGSPTVILEAGGGHFSATWAHVQPVIAEVTRVCAYDRAGYGWSEPGPLPRDAQHIAAELHALLALAGVEPPYVLVGHSIGGVYARVYHARYPGEVDGMVLVDATHPDTWARQGESIEMLRTVTGVSGALSRVGMMRLYAGSQAFGLPAADEAALRANMSSSRYWDTQRDDVAAIDATLDQGRAAGDLEDLPLAVMGSVDYPEGPGRETELALQQELAALSTNGTYQSVDGARHMTLLTEARYAAVVGDTVVSIVESVREARRSE